MLTTLRETAKRIWPYCCLALMVLDVLLPQLPCFKGDTVFGIEKHWVSLPDFRSHDKGCSRYHRGWGFYSLLGIGRAHVSCRGIIHYRRGRW